MSNRCYLSVVSAVYNEEDCIEEFIRQVEAEMHRFGYDYEIILVDDGSSDRTVEIASQIASKNPRIKVVELSYNHGKPRAVSAAMSFSKGEYVLMMDPDLQDPPDGIHLFVEKIVQGFDLVYGVRIEKHDTFFRKVLSGIFWWVLENFTGVKLPRGISAMRIMSRRFTDQFLLYRELNRFIEGMFSHVGMKQTSILIENRPRFAGTSKFNFRRRMQLAVNAILDYSDLPLKLTVRFGMLLTVVGFLTGSGLILAKLMNVEFQAGWPSLVTILVSGFGLQIFFMGLLGTYLGRIYNEVKARPLYSIRNKVNL